VKHLIELYAEKLGLPQAVTERAKEIEQKLLTSNNKIDTESAVAASIMIASRELGYPISALAIGRALGKTQHFVLNAYKKACKALGIKLPPPDTIKILNTVAEKLKLPPDTVELAKKICLLAKDRIANGRDPYGVVAACIWIADYMIRGNNGVTQKTLAQAVGASIITIRKRAKEILKLVNNMLNEVK
jgi:transcription initiation factor TFIIIB Brf1 subunit/transcription initiation factor TFIIB